MKLLTYRSGSVDYVGILSSNLKHVYPIKHFGIDVSSMQELIETLTDERFAELKKQFAAVDGKPGLSYSSLTKRPPVPYFRRDMICIGFNFRNHAEEIAKLRGESVETAKVADPIYFVKRCMYATGDGDAIPYFPGYATNLDVGVESCVIIKKDALNITEDQVRDYVFGYTVANDVCDTRINKVYTQPFWGKSIDGYMPIGPWIVTADEFEDKPLFDLKLTVNGKVRQEGNTANLVFSIPFIVSQLSQNMTLKAGTMISTGSPANKDAGCPEKLLLLPGDEIKCEIKGIGTLTNYVVEKG